ncbi:MAG: aldehyde dehydrogenase family protein, partial [Alphaproteobacteria bacterium]|nr:aldehyde dehydrogenase family protein [Alphaproteobacteria bacterium]
MHVSLLINGVETSAAGGRTFTRINPFTQEVATTASAASLEDAAAAVDAAAAAFPAWSRTGPGERRKILLKAADIMEAKTAEFSELVIAETGATGHWGAFNVMVAASMLREAASMTTQISGEVIPSNKPGSLSMGMRQAVGVCLGIAPWNAPIILGTRAVAMPLA